MYYLLVHAVESDYVISFTGQSQTDITNLMVGQNYEFITQDVYDAFVASHTSKPGELPQ